MVCESRIYATKMHNWETLVAALEELGYKVIEKGPLHIETSSGLEYTRSREGEEYGFNCSQQNPQEVGIKYAELTTRAWARKNSMSVVMFKDNKMKLVARRG